MTKTHVLEFKNKSLVPLLFGEHNSHLSHLEKKLNILIADRGHKLTLSGHPADIAAAENILNGLWARLKGKQDIGIAEIDAALRFNENERSGENKGKKKMSGDKVVIKTKKKDILPRSPNQADYLTTIRSEPMVFGTGPAGTGKTYLAVAAGVSMYLEGEVERLIFTRPVLEAGENLGFLPGDIKEKIDPYVRPIYDALQDMMPWEDVVKKMENGSIEVAPLAFMRGRTLSNAFVLLDEAQNTTTSQMKMFLTRMGESSRMVVTGDVSQTDLPRGVKSGLQDAMETLSDVDEIKFMSFSNKDVVRHPLVGKIVKAYDKHN